MHMHKKSFTLIEILVVISIIGLLAGLAMGAIRDAMITAKQAESANNLKQMVQGVLARQTNSRSLRFKSPYNSLEGIRTLVDEEMELEEGDLLFSGNIILTTDPAFKSWAELSGKHPLDPEQGFYVFHGVDSSGNIKSRLKSDVRVAMEFFDYVNEGHGKVAVAFADGHMAILNVSTPPGELDIIEALSVRGENDGNL